MSADKRKKLIEEASQYVTVDRNASYGEPEDNFQIIADVWNAQGFRKFDKYKEPCAITAADVALMMAGMKLARLSGNPKHQDSWVDLIGYAACGGDIAIPDPEPEWTADGMTIKPEDLEPVPEALKGVGRWVSDNRCGERFPEPHEAHSYGTDAFDQPTRCVHSRACNWCDGYVIVPAPKIPDSAPCGYEHPNGQRCKGVAHGVQMPHDFGPVPRPIKDNPQA